MQKGLFEMSVAIPRDGISTKIREFGHGGYTYVEGRKGQKFSIMLRNNSSMRSLFILSVDGLDVIDGKPATASSRGYIVAGYSSAEITGWRESPDVSHDFFFTERSKSYSAGSEVHSTQHCGVIGAKIIAEIPPVMPIRPIRPIEIHHHHHHSTPPLQPTGPAVPWEPVWGGSIASSTTGGTGLTGHLATSDMELYDREVTASACFTAATPSFTLGTGWGEARADHVELVDFRRGGELAELAIYYAEAEHLRAIGISLEKEVAVPTAMPSAFGGFCPPPKW